MATVSKWAGVGVAMQSALAASQVISGVTKANPGVATYVGTDTVANGDFVIITALGMGQIDGRVFRVANVNTGSNTFELEGEDTTLYDTFTSGSFAEPTIDVNFSTLTDLSGSGGTFDFIDTTTIHLLRKTQIPGSSDPAVYEFGSIWDVSDAGLKAAKAASDQQGQRAFKFSFANGQKMLFNGFVGCTLIPGGTSQDKVTTKVTITMFGNPTYYAS